MNASCKQAALKSCQEEEQEEEVETVAQEYSSRLFLARGQLWPRAEAQQRREKLTHEENTYSHTPASTHTFMVRVQRCPPYAEHIHAHTQRLLERMMKTHTATHRHLTQTPVNHNLKRRSHRRVSNHSPHTLSRDYHNKSIRV